MADRRSGKGKGSAGRTIPLVKAETTRGKPAGVPSSKNPSKY